MQRLLIEVALKVICSAEKYARARPFRLRAMARLEKLQQQPHLRGKASDAVAGSSAVERYTAYGEYRYSAVEPFPTIDASGQETRVPSLPAVVDHPSLLGRPLYERRSFLHGKERYPVVAAGPDDHPQLFSRSAPAPEHHIVGIKELSGIFEEIGEGSRVALGRGSRRAAGGHSRDWSIRYAAYRRMVTGKRRWPLPPRNAILSDQGRRSLAVSRELHRGRCRRAANEKSDSHCPRHERAASKRHDCPSAQHRATTHRGDHSGATAGMTGVGTGPNGCGNDCGK
jgi:hypothetical protein